MAAGRARRLAWITLAGLTIILLILAVLTHFQGERLLRDQLLARLSAQLVLEPRIDAPIEWRLRPEPTLTVRELSLVDSQGGMRVRVGTLTIVADRDALLERRVHVRSIALSGLAVTLSSDDPSHWQADGWLLPGDGGGQAPLPPIDEIRVDDANLDVEGTRPLQLDRIALSAGPFRPGMAGRFTLDSGLQTIRPVPAGLRIALSGGFDPPDRAPRLFDLALSVEGSIGGFESFRLTADVPGVAAGEAGRLELDGLSARLLAEGPHTRMASSLTLARLGGRGAAWTGTDAVLDGDVTHEARIARGQLRVPVIGFEGMTLVLRDFVLSLKSTAEPAVSLALNGDLSASMDAEDRSTAVLSLSAVRAAVDLPHPRRPDRDVAFRFGGDATVIGKIGDSVLISEADGRLDGEFDQTRFAGEWRFDTEQTPPLALALALDKLDLDAYLPEPSEPAAGDGGFAGADLGIWRDWPVTGELRIGELRIRGFVTRDAVLRLGPVD